MISGSDIVLYKYDSVLAKDIPIACGLEANLSIVSELKEVTSQTSARYREFRPDINSWSISARGLTFLNDQYNYSYLMTAIKNQETFLIKYVIDNGTILGLTIFSGNVYITNYEMTGTFDEISTYTIQLQGTGTFSLSGTVVTPGGTVIISGTTIQVFQVVASGGETSINFSGTTGLDAVYASRGGTTIQPLAFAGSPTDPNGGVWNTTTGQLNIPTTNPAFAGENFLLLAQ